MLDENRQKNIVQDFNILKNVLDSTNRWLISFLACQGNQIVILKKCGCHGNLIDDGTGTNCICPGNLVDDSTGKNCTCQEGLGVDDSGIKCIGK